MFCVIFEADVSTGLQGIGELRKKCDTMMQIRSIRSARCQADKKQLKKRFGISAEPNPVLELAVDPHEYYAPHNVACKSTLLFPYLGLHLWRCCIPCCWALINPSKKFLGKSCPRYPRSCILGQEVSKNLARSYSCQEINAASWLQWQNCKK